MVATSNRREQKVKEKVVKQRERTRQKVKEKKNRGRYVRPFVNITHGGQWKYRQGASRARAEDSDAEICIQHKA